MLFFICILNLCCPSLTLKSISSEEVTSFLRHPAIQQRSGQCSHVFRGYKMETLVRIDEVSLCFIIFFHSTLLSSAKKIRTFVFTSHHNTLEIVSKFCFQYLSECKQINNFYSSWNHLVATVHILTLKDPFISESCIEIKI